MLTLEKRTSFAGSAANCPDRAGAGLLSGKTEGEDAHSVAPFRSSLGRPTSVLVARRITTAQQPSMATDRRSARDADVGSFPSKPIVFITLSFCGPLAGPLPSPDSRPHETGFVREHDCLNPVPKLKLRQQVTNVAFYRCVAHEQFGGYLRVGHAPSDELKDLTLSGGEPGQRIGSTERREPSVLLDDPPSNRWRQQPIPGSDDSHGLDELFGWSIL